MAATKKYIDYIDLNGRHDKQFEFTVRVTFDKYDDPEYILFNIISVVAKDNRDAEQKAKDIFADQIGAGKANRKYLKAYVINYLNAPVANTTNPNQK